MQSFIPGAVVVEVVAGLLLFSAPVDPRRGLDDEAEMDLWTPRLLSPVPRFLVGLPGPAVACVGDAVAVPLLPATLADPVITPLEG